MLQQAGEPLPDDMPFKDTLALAENDPTVDPFDAIEMIGVPGGMATSAAGAAGSQPPIAGADDPGHAPRRAADARLPLPSCQLPVAGCKTDYVLLATGN